MSLLVLKSKTFRQDLQGDLETLGLKEPNCLHIGSGFDSKLSTYTYLLGRLSGQEALSLKEEVVLSSLDVTISPFKESQHDLVIPSSPPYSTSTR
jgi:hypothetical protein